VVEVTTIVVGPPWIENSKHFRNLSNSGDGGGIGGCPGLCGFRIYNPDGSTRFVEVSETYSDGQGFGTPKTRSSERVIPMSSALRQVLESHRTIRTCREPEDLVFCTNKGTPLSPKNLYNRALAPTCDELGLPRVSWHSFRHASGTWIGEVGESVKTVQAILGHSDLETTLNIYMHAIPDSQRRAVERVAGVLFPDVPKLASGPTELAD
jgi:integrase